jgi:hypothetical protein
MHKGFALMVCVVAFVLSGCTTVQRHSLSDVIWRGNTLHVSSGAADRIGRDTSDLLDTHYQRSAAFQIVATEENLVTDAIIQHLRSMGYAVDVVFQGSRKGVAVAQPGEVLMSLAADNIAEYKDIVRVDVHVDRVTATRIYTSASGLATGPWAVTATPLKPTVTVGPVIDMGTNDRTQHGAGN